MEATQKEPIRVRVMRRDMAEGIAGDCFRCAVGLALARATGDDHANVYERDFVMYIEVWSRHIPAPYDVRKFVWAYDGLPRNEDGRPRLRVKGQPPPKPFRFELPDQTDPDWRERCSECGGLFAGVDLDDEGDCEDCRKTD